MANASKGGGITRLKVTLGASLAASGAIFLGYACSASVAVAPSDSVGGAGAGGAAGSVVSAGAAGRAGMGGRSTGGGGQGGNGGEGCPVGGGGFGGFEGLGAGTVLCDDFFCKLPAEVCCKPQGAPLACAPAGATGCLSKYACDGPEDCAPGEHCCLTTFNEAHCSSLCDSFSILCNDPGDCDPGKQCNLPFGGPYKFIGHCLDATPGRVLCGDETCALPTPFCCSGPPRSGCNSPKCSATGNECGCAALGCDGTEDCGPCEVCCPEQTMGQGGQPPVKVSCRKSCASPILCNDASDCPSGLKCVPGYFEPPLQDHTNVWVCK